MQYLGEKENKVYHPTQQSIAREMIAIMWHLTAYLMEKDPN
ncbi:hypothetical protein [Mucilaginibacter antarcticus]